MGLDFKHSGTFTRTPSSEGSGGRKVAGTPITIYDGKVDVQTNDRRQDVSMGIETSKGSGRVFFPVSIMGLGLDKGDSATLNVEGSVFTGRVDRVSEVDDSCLVLYA